MSDDDMKMGRIEFGQTYVNRDERIEAIRAKLSKPETLQSKWQRLMRERHELSVTIERLLRERQEKDDEIYDVEQAMAREDGDAQ